MDYLDLGILHFGAEESLSNDGEELKTNLVTAINGLKGNKFINPER